ncbi:MAG: J domain-containing protein [Alphaproteobacteria bacterium]
MPRFDPFALNEAPRARPCDRPGCPETGEFRAPKSRDSLNEFFWFCTDHIRDYNKAWNYCAGMSAAQIEAEIRQDTVWRRPTWPLGNFGRPGRWQDIRHARFHDGFAEFDLDEPLEGEEDGDAVRPRPGTPEARAMKLMQLESPLTLTQLKARYKELVKQLHPDANGGDKLAEERLKDINEAYSTLKKAVRPNGLGGHP